MPTNWTLPTGATLYKVLSIEMAIKSNEDAAGGTDRTNNLNTDISNRRDEQVKLAIAEVRGAIQAGGKNPLSITALAVPPEMEVHTLNLAAFRLVNSIPSLGMVLMSEGGVYAPLQKAAKEAQDAIAAIRAGRNITLPNDPTGVDYATAVSANNPAIKSVIWGDGQATDDEHNQGFLDDGNETPLVEQNMLTPS